MHLDDWCIPSAGRCSGQKLTGSEPSKAEIKTKTLPTCLPIWQLRRKIQMLPRQIALTLNTRACINTLATKVSFKESLHK